MKPVCWWAARKTGRSVGGALAAWDQWNNTINLDRPRVVRPTDAEIVAALEVGPLNARMLQAFAQEYRVFHYPLAPRAGRDARLEQVSLALDKVYRGGVGAKVESLATLWWQAICSVRDVLIEHGMRERYLRSFCMKVLWFYYPLIATMWDDYAVRALNGRLGTDHRVKVETAEQATDFLADFERLFATYREVIAESLDAIATLSGKRYLYERRVLDKTLWLGGAGDQRVVQMMRRLEGDPLAREMMERSFPALLPD